MVKTSLPSLPPKHSLTNPGMWPDRTSRRASCRTNFGSANKTSVHTFCHKMLVLDAAPGPSTSIVQMNGPSEGHVAPRSQELPP